MIVNASARETLKGPQKAAAVLASLGEQASAEILKQLSEDEVDIVSQAVARMGQVGPDSAESLLEEFHQLTVAADFVVRGGVDYAKKMLFSAFGAETARRVSDRMSKALGNGIATFDALQKTDPDQLAKFIAREHPQTIALVLAHLNPTQAAGLLSSLPAAIKADVTVRMANLDQISPEIVKKIASVISQKLKAFRDFSRESAGGVKAVAEMFNRLDSGTSKEILQSIEHQDPQLYETIRQMMFVFEDLLLIDAQGIKDLLSRVDRKVLTIALKGTTEQLRNWVMGTMSQRGAEMLKEDIEALGPIKIRDVESAQQAIIAVVRQLETEGIINLKGAVGEQYVV